MNNFIKDYLIEIKNHNFLNPELELRALLSHCSYNNEIVLLNNFKVNGINFQKFQHLIFLPHWNQKDISF